MMTGIIDVGGGLRGAYTAGVYDYLLEQGIEFPYCLGVSAGSANMITYLAKQRGRNLRFYTRYALRKEYMSVRNFLRTGSYLGMDYIYSELSNTGGEDPIDYDTYENSFCQFLVAATDAQTGAPHYFTRADIARDRYDVLKASCSLPIACKPYWIGGRAYFDGGISDPVPYQKALQDGCDRIVVLLTRPKKYRRPPQKHLGAAKFALRAYPETLKSLRMRHIRYNRAVDEVEELERQGKALLLAPADIQGMSTLSRDPEAMKRLYQYGYQDGRKIADFL